MLSFRAYWTRSSTHRSLATTAAVAAACLSSVVCWTEPSSRQQPPSSSTVVSSARTYFQQHGRLPPPSVPHATLPKDVFDSDQKQSILVIGDVHGCLDELLLLHEKARREIDQDDFAAVICVGDLVNKGPKSEAVVKHVRQQPQWYSVRGNHDDSGMLAALGEPRRRESPEYAWVPKLTEDDLAWMLELPYTLWIDSLQTMIVHAGFVPGVKLEEQDTKQMVTIRNVVEDASKSEFRAASPSDKGEAIAWAQAWNDNNPPYEVIFGHDAKRGLQMYDNVRGLDSGCCYGKHLTGVMLPSGSLVQVEAKEIYSPIVEKK